MENYSTMTPEDRLGIKRDEEFLFKPKEIQASEEKKITVDRRLTKVFPVEGRNSRISFVYVENPDTSSKNKGKFLYGAGPDTELGHSAIFGTAVEVGIVSEKSEDPKGGGILKVVDDEFVYERNSDQYGDVQDEEVLEAFIKQMNREYPMDAYDAPRQRKTSKKFW